MHKLEVESEDIASEAHDNRRDQSGIVFVSNFGRPAKIGRSGALIFEGGAMAERTEHPEWLSRQFNDPVADIIDGLGAKQACDNSLSAGIPIDDFRTFL